MKAENLLHIAGKTLDKGNEITAKSIVILALKQEDAVDALDKLLPSVPEPEFIIEEDTLSDQQVAKILAVARDLQRMSKFKIANQILARVEKIEADKKRKKRS